MVHLLCLSPCLYVYSIDFSVSVAIASGNLRFICSHCSSTYSVNKRFGWRQLIGFGTRDDDLLHFKTDLLAAFTWSQTTPHTLLLLAAVLLFDQPISDSSKSSQISQLAQTTWILLEAVELCDNERWSLSVGFMLEYGIEFILTRYDQYF